MRSETFHASAHADGGLAEVLLGIVAVLTALLGLGLAIDIDFVGVLSGLTVHAPLHAPNPGP